MLISSEVLLQECNILITIICDCFDYSPRILILKKTSALEFHNAQKKISHLNLKVISYSPSSNQEVKFPALHLDDTLNFMSHCAFIIVKVYSLRFMLRNLWIVLTEKELLSVYYAQIISTLSYVLCFWNSHCSECILYMSKKNYLSHGRCKFYR